MAHDLIERSGRSYCGICNGVEGSSLPTDCPGTPLTRSQVDAVYRGRLDFIGGEWVNPNAPPVPEPSDPPPEQPTTTSHSTSVTVEVDDPDPDPRDNSDNNPVLVPVPVPVPVPIPGSQGTETDPGTEDPDIILDVHTK